MAEACSPTAQEVPSSSAHTISSVDSPLAAATSPNISVGEVLKDILVQKHAAYILNFEKAKEDYEFVMTEHIRMNGLYWCVTAMDIMGELGRMDRAGILEFVNACQHADGGFSSCPRLDPHVHFTLSAIQILITLDALEERHINTTVSFIQSLQLSDGSFQGDKWGEIDTRFSFCAIACLALLGRLDAINTDLAVEFIMKCMNFDGGFGCVPGSETHAAQVYCCVGALAILHKLHLVDADLLGWWLCERQLPTGGLNGRPEKLPDVCYGWWVVAPLSVLQRLHWLDQKKLRVFIVQSQDEDGGMADRPGDMVDPFHTLFGLTSLSLMGEPGLRKINPVYCMCEDVLIRAGVEIPPSAATW